MQYARTLEGETLSILIERLYCKVADRDRKKIARAILEMNPSLKGTKELPEGALLQIPTIEGFATPTAVHTEREIAADLIREAQEQLGDLGPVLAQLVDQQEAESEERLKLTKSPEVRRLAKREEFVAERVAAVAAGTSENLKRMRELRKVIKKADTELTSDLNALVELLDPRPKPTSKRARRESTK